MKKDENKIESKENLTEPSTNPENKFKEGSKPVNVDAINNIIKSPVERAKENGGEPLSEEGTNVDYTDEG